jgi:hypothetical protein
MKLHRKSQTIMEVGSTHISIGKKVISGTQIIGIVWRAEKDPKPAWNRNGKTLLLISLMLSSVSKQPGDNLLK